MQKVTQSRDRIIMRQPNTTLGMGSKESLNDIRKKSGEFQRIRDLLVDQDTVSRQKPMLKLNTSASRNCESRKSTKVESGTFSNTFGQSRNFFSPKQLFQTQNIEKAFCINDMMPDTLFLDKLKFQKARKSNQIKF
jgi:hypothetical protein